VVVGFESLGPLGGNGGDLGRGRDKNSSVIVACHIRMGL
jgi:hypothetical protein